VAECAGVAQW